MAREIKFRGKRLENVEWVYGFYHTHIAFRIEVTYINEHAVDPATVGQYTGLKDKNGVEIYEGDSLSNRDKTGMELVIFDEETCQFTTKGRWLWTIASSWEVIGNEHENPELLEVAE